MTKNEKETLKCPFCGKILDLDIDEGSEYYSCPDAKCWLFGVQYGISHISALTRQVDSIKQKAYNEGYNRGMAEWVELTTRQTSEKVEQQVKHDLEIVNKIAELKKYWIKEGRKQVLAELKKELE